MFFINEPKHLINPVRDVYLFETPLIEIVSKTPWYLIPITYIPMIIYFIMKSELNIVDNVFYYSMGVLSWTILEYAIHRCVFHGEDKWVPANNYAYVFHFIIHGIHHAFP
jgi:4-hydroxysphinganine ceramide fatty acyl 2-hydroxylase